MKIDDLKTYDIYMAIFRERIREFLLRQMHDQLFILGAAYKLPDIDDIEFVSTVAALFILHSHGIEIDSKIDGVEANKEEIYLAMNCLKDLQETLKAYSLQMRHMDQFTTKGEA